MKNIEALLILLWTATLYHFSHNSHVTNSRTFRPYFPKLRIGQMASNNSVPHKHRGGLLCLEEVTRTQWTVLPPGGLCQGRPAIQGYGGGGGVGEGSGSQHSASQCGIGTCTAPKTLWVSSTII